MATIASDTSPVVAALFAVTGGRFRVQLQDPKAPPGQRWGSVLDDAGERIGEAYDYVYGGAGFSVHTRPFAGYVSCDCIDFVP